MPKPQRTFEQIHDILRDELGKRWLVGDRLPAVTELASELGVGQRNTLRAIQLLVAEGLLESTPGRGTTVTSNVVGRPAADRRVVLVTRHTHPDGFLIEMCEAFASTLMQAGGHIERVGERELTRQRNDYRSADLESYDGIVLINPEPFHPIRLAEHSNISLGVMSTTARVDFGISRNYDMVTIDEFRAGELAGETIRKHHAAESVFVVGVRDTVDPDAFHDVSQIRVEGLVANLEREVDRSNLFLGGGHSEAAGAKAGVQFAQMQDRPTCVFCTSDDLAYGFAVATAGFDLIAGRDYALLGFDGQYRTRHSSVSPPISSIAIPTQRMGQRAAELLIERMADPNIDTRTEKLLCELFVGNTLNRTDGQPAREEMKL